MDLPLPQISGLVAGEKPAGVGAGVVPGSIVMRLSEADSVTVERALVAVLLTATATEHEFIGLPVPPLLRLIARYSVTPFVGEVTTLCGSKDYGSRDGAGREAKLYGPNSICGWRDPETGENVLVIAE